METADTAERDMLECCGINCTGQRLAEVAGGVVMVSVDRDDIQRIALRHGLIAPRPAIQIGAGVLLAALGYLPAMHLIHWLRHGGTVLTLEAWLIPAALVGLWLIISAFRRGYFLEVESTQGRKRLAFHPQPDPAALTAFVAALEQHCDLRIERLDPGVPG